MKDTLRMALTGEQQIADKIKRETEKLKASEIFNSITHLEISLDKYLEKASPQELENVYYHIGAIKGALR